MKIIEISGRMCGTDQAGRGNLLGKFGTGNLRILSAILFAASGVSAVTQNYYVADPMGEKLNALIRGVAGASIQEFDRVIAELQGVRNMFRSEGERLNRELAGYASLSHASMTAMKVIGDSLKRWKDATVNDNHR